MTSITPFTPPAKCLRCSKRILDGARAKALARPAEMSHVKKKTHSTPPGEQFHPPSPGKPYSPLPPSPKKKKCSSPSNKKSLAIKRPPKKKSKTHSNRPPIDYSNLYPFRPSSPLEAEMMGWWGPSSFESHKTITGAALLFERFARYLKPNIAKAAHMFKNNPQLTHEEVQDIAVNAFLTLQWVARFEKIPEYIYREELKKFGSSLAANGTRSAADPTLENRLFRLQTTGDMLGSLP